jgi:hypothetical protein
MKSSPSLFFKTYFGLFNFIAAKRLAERDLSATNIHIILTIVFTTSILMWAYVILALYLFKFSNFICHRSNGLSGAFILSRHSQILQECCHFRKYSSVLGNGSSGNFQLLHRRLFLSNAYLVWNSSDVRGIDRWQAWAIDLGDSHP